MASIAHALHLAAPVIGRVYSFSVPTTCTGVDLNTALGAGAMSSGGYIDIILTADSYYAFGGSVASVVTSGSTSAGMYIPGGQRVTIEPPSTSGYQYLVLSAVTGTAYAYVHKSSFADNEQYRAYILGKRATVL